jgi:hypothetical protein
MRCTLRMWSRVLWALLVVATTVVCQAQEFRATLTGQVTDSSGALVTGATVTAVNIDLGTTYTGKTSDKGVYYINYVLPGSYSITAEAQGFKTAKQDKVTTFAAETFNQNFKLEIGGTQEMVVVSAEPPQLETSTGSGGTIITGREVENVPINGGQAYALIGTTVGSQITGNNYANSGWDVNSSYSLGGGIAGNNQFTLNGANITSQFGYDNHSPGEWSAAPNADTVQEVNVQINTYDARYGRTSGGTVNTVTKSGSNQFHGSARYGYEDTFLNANTYQNKLNDEPRSGLLQNQFWITAGGPIVKNKLFFFFGFEGYHQKLPLTSFYNVPPAYLRPGYQGNSGVNFGLVQALDSGEFPNGIQVFQPGTASCLDGGAVTACDSNHVAQQLYPNDTIPGSAINGTAAAVLQYVPLPNIPAAANLVRGNNYFANTPGTINYNQPSIRVDYNLSERTKLYSYFLYWKGKQNRSTNGLSGVAENGNINWAHQTYVAVQDLTHVFSPTFTGDFRVSFTRFLENSPDGEVDGLPAANTIGLSMPLPATTATSLLPEFSIKDNWGTGVLGGAQVFGNQTDPDVSNNFGFNVDFTKTKGAHTMEFGAEIDEFQYGGFPSSGGHPNGSFSFDSGWTQYNPHNSSCWPVTPSSTASNGCNGASGQSPQPNGSALASFYVGQPASGGVDWFTSEMEGYPVIGGYFQDAWRATAKLTMTFGLRYDVQRGLRERNNALNRGLCLTCVNPLTNDPTYQANVANGANAAAWQAAGISPSSLTQVLGGIQFAGVGGQSRDAYNTDWSNVGPRFSLAYQIDRNTVIRGGFGVMYSFGLEGGSNVGEAQTTTYTNSTDGGNTPTSYFQSGNPYPQGLLKPTGSSLGLLTDVGNGGVSVDFPGRKIPMEQITSLGIQRELPGQMVLDVAYAGNFTRRLRTFLWINGTASLAQQQQAQANPAYFDQQVPNPYYNVPGISGSGQCGTSSTVNAVSLLLPLSQYCSPGGRGLVGEYNAPIGGNFWNGLETQLTKRVFGQSGKGFTYRIAYTYSKNIDEDGYRNGWPYQDPDRTHQLNSFDRTHVLSVTSVYDLPFGKGRQLLNKEPAFVDRLISGWTLSGVFSAQSGTPVQISTSWYYTCPNQSFRPAGGSTLGHWFSTAGANPDQCWTQVPEYGLMPINDATAQVRNPTIPDLDLSLQKNTQIFERLGLNLRLDAFNATNSVLFGGPNTNPGAGAASFNSVSGWSGFGTVGFQQQNPPRILQLMGKIIF